MNTIRMLWSDPLLASAIGLIVVLVIGVIVACVEIYREGQESGVTTTAELRKDAYTQQPKDTLRKMQERAAYRLTHSRRQDLRGNRSGEGSQR